MSEELKLIAADHPLPIELPQRTVTTDLVVFSANATKSSGGLAGNDFGVAEIASEGVIRIKIRDRIEIDRLIEEEYRFRYIFG
jgi:hypothetical protein